MIDSYYKQIIYPFVLDLVNDFIYSKGYEITPSIEDFNEDDISRFAAILLGQHPEDYSEIVFLEDQHLLAMAALRSADKEEKIIWADKLIKSIIEYFTPKMSEILEEIFKNQKSDFYETNGYNYHIDSQTGEGRWIK